MNLKENLFTILCATKSIPHPEKTHGEDAFYVHFEPTEVTPLLNHSEDLFVVLVEY